MADEEAPEPDRVGDLPHPRETAALFGQDSAERGFLDAWAAGRMHHAWLLTGPRGVGKATLAYRIARTRLAHGEEDGAGLFGASAVPENLDMTADDGLARRIAAGSEPRLTTLRRSVDEKTGRLRSIISVDDVRRLKSFFQLSAADGGWRAAVVDTADEMNTNAANALLKLLEEPPSRSLFLLISHAPARLLPTIRSRCRVLKCASLGADDLGRALVGAGVDVGDALPRLAVLSGGSAGEAARLAERVGAALYAQLVRTVTRAPGMDRGELIALAEACAGRGAEEVYDLTVRLLSILLSRLARTAASGPPEALAAAEEEALFARLATGPHAARIWADLSARIEDRIGRARAVNLDPAMVMLDTFFDLDAAARDARARVA